MVRVLLSSSPETWTATVSQALTDVFDLARLRGATQIVVMAADLDFIDFTGVEVLAAAARRADRLGGSFVVSGANPDVAEILTFAGQGALMDRS